MSGLFNPAHWGWPQVAWLALQTWALGWATARHGETQQQKISVWVSLITTAIVLAILICGGFSR